MTGINIGGVRLRSRAVMAPVAGLTDQPFRRIAMEYGAGLTVTELLSANALVRDSKRTFEMLPSKDEPRPVAVQLFGSDPAVMGEAARIVEELNCCDMIDLNFGCPVKKVVKTGAGAAILKDPQIACNVVSSVVSAVKIPVTVKIRIGWDKTCINAVTIAKTVADAGVVAIAVHGRTASQGYTGKADWSVISDVARAVQIPVIGNGDIKTPEEALERLETAGVAMIMIGRGAIGAPWIFDRFNKLLSQGSCKKPDSYEIAGVILRHIRLMKELYGEKRTVSRFRTHIGYYTKGLPGASRLRSEMNRCETIVEIDRLVTDYFGKSTE